MPENVVGMTIAHDLEVLGYGYRGHFGSTPAGGTAVAPRGE